MTLTTPSGLTGEVEQVKMLLLQLLKALALV